MESNSLTGIALLAVAAVSFHVPVMGQTRDPAAATKTGGSIATPQYVQQAALGDLFEIESSKLALKKASANEVKQFAQKMVDDHTQSGQKLKEALGTAGAKATIPAELDKQHQQMVDRLNKAASGEFDRLYLEMQLQAHQKALQVHTSYAKTGDNQALQSVAAAIAPVVEGHLTQLRKLTQQPKAGAKGT